jgi:hypothetical protein
MATTHQTDVVIAGGGRYVCVVCHIPLRSSTTSCTARRLRSYFNSSDLSSTATGRLAPMR